MDLKTFEKNLPLILANGQKVQKLIHECGCYAIEIVNLHGTVGEKSPIERFWNTVNSTKGIDRQAVLNWLTAFAYVRFSKNDAGDLVPKYQDKSTSLDKNAAIELAKTVPFWEFTKEPVPVTRPYDVMNALKQIASKAKLAATGGANHDKPKRKVEHANLLSVIDYVLSNPDHAIAKLGLEKPSKEVEKEFSSLLTVNGEKTPAKEPAKKAA